MTTTDGSELLRPGLLQGVSIMLACTPPTGAGGGSLGSAVHATCAQLGARVGECRLGGGDRSLELEEAAVEQALERLLVDGNSLELLVVDGAGLFAQAIAGGGPESAREALRACLDASWNVTRAVATRAFLPGGRGGRIVYLAPARDAGDHADAARAGLENLARTLSIEWARHAITTVAIVPGTAVGTASDAATAGVRAAGEVAVLTAYLASVAGAYFSGCLLDLGAVGGRVSWARR